MEGCLHMQKPLRVVLVSGSKRSLIIKPFQAFLPHGTTTMLLQSDFHTKGRMEEVGSSAIVASAEFSRRRPRKNISSTIKNSDPKGFKPKPSTGLGTQKRDQKSNEGKEVSQTVLSKGMGQDDTSTHTMKNVESERASGLLENEMKSLNSRKPSEDKQSGSSVESVGTTQGYFEEQLEVKNDFVQGEQMGFIRSKDMKYENDEPQETIMISDGAVEVPVIESRVDREKVHFSESDLNQDHADDGSNNNVQSTDSVSERIFSHKEQDKEIHAKIKLETEAKLHRKALESLAKKNLLEGNKVFNYPEVIKPDENIAIFLNKSLSSLKDEPDILIKGAFNNWTWRYFTLKLNKSNLDGDWWYCQIRIPREAYNLDFVFFNGNEVYDNNDGKDFCINVEGGMSMFEFEDFLLQEKHKELERLSKEQAEMERQAEEKRRSESERAASEADRAEAREEVAKRRAMLQELTKKAKKSGENIWCIEPCEFSSADKVRLYYNRTTGPLIYSTHIWVHGGHNNWQDGLSIVERLIKSDKEGGDWWYSDIIVPDHALVLDWVFADGPPQDATIYDNNNFQDFHAIVSQRISEDFYWVEEEHNLYKRLQEERRLREEQIRAKVEKTAQMKAAVKEKTLKTYLLSQKHIVYTEPLNVQAGKPVTVYYNPESTVLNGKPEIWFRGSFNRWTHRFGPLPAQKMLPAEIVSHVKTTVKVPLDAYMMDFVFSESMDGGIFDNKNGMDYHIPVFGGVTHESPMHIVHVAVEMAPIAKVGGLGDVVTSLSRAVQDMNHTVDVILPKYDCLNLSSVKNLHYQTSFSLAGIEVKVWFGKVESVSVYFLEPQNGYVWTGRIYGCQNDGERFNFFCHAALEFLQQNGFRPDIIHCHDWSSAPVAWLFKEHYKNYGLSKARVVFTIHNLEFGAQNIERAMLNSDKATTVSPTYSKEVSGNPVVAPYLYKFHGILNGIDPDIWDPFNDKFIPISYTSENVCEGKRAAKDALQQRLGLKRADLPLVGIITRLTHQKGIHLIKHAIGRTLERNGQIVLLGSAPDPRIQTDFVNMANHLHSTHNDRARLCLTYDEPLSHLIYAGADFILVPSIFEPCGLTQLTAMRYGSIPVVRKTGGLYDTVFDVDHDKERAQSQGLEPNGFNFDGADTAGVDYALNRAISAWFDGREWFNSLCKRVMEQDWSWNRPALDYLELYYAARK